MIRRHARPSQNRGNLFGLCVALWIVLSVAAARAEVTRFEIHSREPFAGGHEFGSVGAYQRIVGRVYYELDPDAPANQNVVDLRLAPRNDRGKVELFGDLFILAPQDFQKGNGALLYDVNNRGNKLALAFFNDAPRTNDPVAIQHAGNGFLMRHGFTIVWSGWDGELLPGDQRLQLSPPVARAKEGRITGVVRCEFVPDEPAVTRSVVNWPNHGSYWPTEEGVRTATLTSRLLPGQPRVPVPRSQWQLHVTPVESDAPAQLPRVEVEMPEGFEPGRIYELIYEARDPLVQGTCFTAVRDLVSALKHGEGKNNPLADRERPVIRRAYAFGVSQSGRFLRELLYWGFNQDEQGRQVFEGVMPHVAGGGLGSFNHRFAQPTRHGAQHDHHDYPADRFPFTYESQYDPQSGQTDGILMRALASHTAPYVVHTQSSAEYWTRSGSLVHTDPLGQQDGHLPDQVRVYAFGGTQHGPSGFPPNKGLGQNLTNPGDYKPFLRALLLALDRWSSDGTPPPASVYPTIRDGTLVDWHQSSTGFPSIPGVRYPRVIQQPCYLDFGPRWNEFRIVDSQPPIPRGDYRVLVPRCDEDGNDLGCLTPPEVVVPVATYTGWNLRSAQAGAEGELVSLQGSYIPFAATASERQRNGDPRLSVAERYENLESYMQQLQARCRELQEAGYLLAEDTQHIVQVQRQRVADTFAATPASQDQEADRAK